MNKTLKVMTSAALLAGVVAPVAVTTVDAANTNNLVNKVVNVADDFKSDVTKTDHFLRITEDDMEFTSTGDTFRLSLPSGVKWLKDEYKKAANASKIAGGDVKVVSATDRDLELQILNNDLGAADDSYDLPLWYEVDGAEGELKVTVDPRGSIITGGQYTFAIVGDGSTSVSIASVKTIRDGGAIDDIRLDENSIGSLYAKDYDVAEFADPKDADFQEISLTLPSNFQWKDGSDIKANPGKYIEAAGGFTGKIGALEAEVDENKLTILFKFDGEPEKIGTFYIKGLSIDADKDADYGEIEVDLDGDEVSSGTMVIAKYGDFGTTAELEDDVPTLLAGRLTDDKKDIETVEVLLKETVAGSWLSNRTVDIEFPTWVKVVGVDISDDKNIDNAAKLITNMTDDIKGDSNEISFDTPDMGDSGKKEFKVKFYISSKADTEGDVTVKIGGRAGIEVDETVIAKVVSPVKVETEKVDVRTGIKEQPLNDIVITEAVKGALLDNREVQLKLSDGEFTDNEPTITVEEGNVKIDEDSIDINEDGILTFEIDGKSTRASKIKISGLSLDLSRSVPEGDVTVEVGGPSILQNSADGQVALNVFGLSKLGDKTYAKNSENVFGDINDSDVDAGEFDRDYVTKVKVATVVTPAEGNVSAETVTLTIGSSTMKVGDKEVALDAAPFIEASTGRTYLPLRAIANAIGASSVEWDNATRTATVVKGGLVAQMTIGQNQYVLNGAKIGMDGKAQIVSERTFLPIRALGNALGANVEWDAATQTVTIK